MAIKQFLGNLADRAGSLSASIGKAPIIKNMPIGIVAREAGKERGISENIAGSRPTVNTGLTPQSRQAGFTPYTPANMSNKSTGLSVSLRRQQQAAQNTNNAFIGPMNNPNRTQNQPQNQPQPQNQQIGGGLSSMLSGGSGGGMSQAEQEAMQRAEEERRLVEEREKKNEEFRNQLGTQYGELRGKFGDILNTFNEKLRTLPENIRQLNQQYKAVIGEKQGQELGQVGQKREQIAQQQKTGLASIAEQVGKRTREGAGRLGSLGMASSAAGMFQRAIQNEANKSARDLLTQAANNYQELDAEENRVKSTYKTMLDELEAEEANNIKDIQNNVNTIIADINERLQRSGEFERMDKEDLNTTYINELTNRFQQAKQASENYKQQLEQWRRDNENKIRNIKNQMVQNFIPREIQGRELTGVRQTKEQQTGMEQGLSPRLLRRVPEDNEEIATPQGLQAITRRLRQNINQ